MMATDKPEHTKPLKQPEIPVQPKRSPAGSDTVVLERRTAKVGPPQMYQVVMLNDDYTPLEFVVAV
jgi:ATP-dependent Clp protease adaptor protein ClpS